MIVHGRSISASLVRGHLRGRVAGMGFGRVTDRSFRRPASSNAVLVGRWRVMPAHSSFAKYGLVVIALVVSAWAGVGPASAAPNECTTTGVTKSVITSIFGAGAKATNVPPPAGSPSIATAVCEVSPPGVSYDDCSNVPSCVRVGTYPAESLASNVANAVTELKEYATGREFEVSVPGAGSGAVLIEDTNYGPQTLGLSPVLYFAYGVNTASVDGSLTTSRPSKKWETLARAIHAHLG